MEKINESKKEKYIIIVLLILIILLIVVSFFVRYLGRINNKLQIPTGNVDIFDIVFCKNNCCGDNCNCKFCQSDNENIICNNCNTNYNNCNNASNSINNNASSEDVISGIIVYDEENKYSENTPLNIFTQTTYYVLKDKIAPESKNSYQFVIRNNNNFNIKYNLEMIEDNKYNINMKYRLKLNGKYVAGNDKEYVTAEELKQYTIGLSSKTYDVYTLDWKWIESDNDTEIGKDINAKYKLNLKISASQY